MDTESFHKALENPGNDPQSRIQWRYRLDWRKPKRMTVALKDLKEQFFYWMFVEGTVEDKIQKGKEEEREKKIRERADTIWDKVRRELRDGEKYDSTKWTKNAISNLADKYQAEYDYQKSIGKSFYVDPLGTALQQHLGIGLGFGFDHMKRLSGEPNSRQLQARAVKSALKRTRKLNKKFLKQRKELKQQIKDSKIRKRKEKELEDERDKEKQAMADKLSELIPTDRGLKLPGGLDELNGFDFAKAILSEGPIKLDGGRFTIVTPSTRRDPVIENLLKLLDEQKNSSDPGPNDDLWEPEIINPRASAQKDSTGPSHDKEKIQDKEDYGKNDEDPAEAYLKQRFRGEDIPTSTESNDDMNDDDDDDDDRMDIFYA